MRDYSDLNLQQLLQPLIENVPEPLQVELDIPTELNLPSIVQAQHLLMLVQEAISNTLKHACATKLSIVARLKPLELAQQELELTITDNGKVAASWQWGNGLTGMQERLAECGGRLLIHNEAGAMQLQIRLPQELASV